MTGHRALEIAAIAAFGPVSVLLAARIAGLASGPAAWAAIGASALAGYVLADLVSGLVHWLADRYGSPETPLVGANLIRPFREHHVMPEDIARHGFVETNGNSCIISLPLLAAARFLAPAAPGNRIALFGLGAVLSLCLAVLLTNQFHKWAHMSRPPALARWLQRARLILTREGHALHHVPPFEGHFCITTGWLNAPLQAAGLFPALERAIQASLGVRPAGAAPPPVAVEEGPNPSRVI